MDEFRNACNVNDSKTAKKFLVLDHKITADNLNFGLRRACFHKNIKLVKLLISHRANDFNDGLKYAGAASSMKLAKLMIQCGATNINSGFMGACSNRTGNVQIVKFMIKQGGSNFGYAFINAYCNRNFRIARKMVLYGAAKLIDIKASDYKKTLIERGLKTFKRDYGIRKWNLKIKVTCVLISDMRRELNQYIRYKN